MMSSNPEWDFKEALANAERIVKLLEYPQTGSLAWAEILIEEYENLKIEIQKAFGK